MDFRKASSQVKAWSDRRSKTEKFSALDHYFMNIIDKIAFLSEVKDIRNELHMIPTVLKHQNDILAELNNAVANEFELLKDKKMNLKVIFDEQIKTIGSHLENIQPMDVEAEEIYKSVGIPVHCFSVNYVDVLRRLIYF